MNVWLVLPRRNGAWQPRWSETMRDFQQGGSKDVGESKLWQNIIYWLDLYCSKGYGQCKYNGCMYV